MHILFSSFPEPCRAAAAPSFCFRSGCCELTAALQHEILYLISAQKARFRPF
ncbi:hypothetical protein ANACOL_01727 [Anaerotruncus colihominis DSM 17241]|uniref:Uncharacterized protein n=1 Tax=Anaerotruncus colihominis DSM 17241 TaxID=445972 RepID=B0PAD0_9FIRM|nr:hypothetical protein ANACOL_01727 [Anaerotruncus colihominis DSM 17241]